MARDPAGSGANLPLWETPGEKQWLTIDDKLVNLTYTLVDAPDEVVRARMDELHAQAELIEEPKWREMAPRHIALLPRDIGGPKPGESPQYWEAAGLVRRYLGTEFEDPVEQVAAGESVLEKVGALSDRAPAEEQTLILGMNSAVARKIYRAQ